MITGFNTDVPFDGVTYHVQTEDKGLDSPLILSLVYVGGAIIASKRTPYEVGREFDEQALTERLQRQHKLIIAAIKAGRIEDLKRMGGSSDSAQAPAPDAQANGVTTAGKKSAGQRKKKSGPLPPAAEASGDPPVEVAASATLAETAVHAPESSATPQAEGAKGASLEAPAPATPAAAKPVTPAAREGERAEPEIVILATLADEIDALGAFSTHPAPKPPAPPADVPPAQAFVTPADKVAVAAPVLTTAELLGKPANGTSQEHSNELYLTLLDDEGEFRAGQLATVKVYVGRGAYGQSPEAEASVTVKVLGTSFRPLILTTATDALGIGVVRALLPRFSSGRAAIIIRAVAGDDSAEMRRIIHQ